MAAKRWGRGEREGREGSEGVRMETDRPTGRQTDRQRGSMGQNEKDRHAETETKTDTDKTHRQNEQHARSTHTNTHSLSFPHPLYLSLFHSGSLLSLPLLNFQVHPV